MEKLSSWIKKIAPLDAKLIEKTQNRLDNLTKPRGSLGRLEDLAKQICAITACEQPILKNKVIFTLAADHGVTAEGVSAYPKEVTEQMVYNFLRGGAAINVLANHIGAKVVIVDIGVAADLKHDSGLIVKKINYGTKNMALGPAMSRTEAIESIETGIDIFEAEQNKHNNEGIHIIGTGEMGIGNTTSSSAITAVVTGTTVEEVTARGAGLDDQGVKHKISVIKKSLLLNRPQREDGLDVLAKVGGFEIGGLAGIIIAASAARVPVVIDGFISGAAALIAYRLAPQVKDYLIASHRSVESGHKIILDYLGLKPLLDLDLRLGEGTGAVLGINLAEISIKVLTQMATFQEANVSERTG